MGNTVTTDHYYYYTTTQTKFKEHFIMDHRAIVQHLAPSTRSRWTGGPSHIQSA